MYYDIFGGSGDSYGTQSGDIYGKIAGL